MKEGTKLTESWEVGPEYEIVREIGTGSYGSVCEAIHKATGTKVAIKKTTRIFGDIVDCKRILREVQLLRMMKHSKANVVKLYEIIEPVNIKAFDCIYMVMEYAQSDLKKLIRAAINLQELHIKKLIYNILSGLKYVHSADVLHRDIKPANILINEDCSVRICDFGLARSIAGIETPSISLGKHKKGTLAEYVSTCEEGKEKKDIKEPIQEAMIDITGKEGFIELVPEVPLTEEEKKMVLHEQLVKTREKRKRMQRQLTSHVVTRWYRAPELILLEKDYGPAIDVWSVGCIFAELLSMLKGNSSSYKDRQPLFPGGSCFPLSPENKTVVKSPESLFSHTDQLNVIFDILGTPTEVDYSFVTDAKAIEYLKAFPPKKKMDLAERYPFASLEAIDFLKRIIIFNPFYRLTIEECLNHPFVAPVRNISNEVVSGLSVKLQFETETYLDAPRLRELFLNEVNYYKELKMKGVFTFT